MNKTQLAQIIRRAAQDKRASLDLSNSNLTALPPEIAKLENLTNLDLRGNQLTSIPSGIGQLVNLEVLNLSRNNLTSLPSEIGKLTKLKRLYLMANQLTALPREVRLLKSLETLELRHNNLQSLPSEIGQLTSLKTLYLRNNRLTRIPSEIGQLSNLTVLFINHNKLTSLPMELGRLERLETLSIEENRLISPPPEIVEQGVRAILVYLREQLKYSSKQWLSKLLVVGEGGVGKTSLLRALRGKPFNSHESTTHGIDIQPLYLKHPTKSAINMQLNAWDFGGQEIYHATHQFFLTNRSLYVLAWNARLGYEQGKLYYWLDTIRARAPESPVLVVATNIDERDAVLPVADLHRKYPQIVGHCEISNKTGDGIDGLRHAITAAAAHLPLMGENWPTNWLNAANDIRKRAKKENYIAPKELSDIMDSHSVTGYPAQVLSQWLHELGDILYFRDDEELNDTVILNPQWVTENISKVLESEAVKDNVGLFTRSQMDDLWININPYMRDHLLRLMEKFDLSYRTLENKDISLVVERLSLDPPKYQKAWDKMKQTGNCREIAMKFLLDTSMPSGIPTWFIARSHRFTTRTHWRFGALFADGAERKHVGIIQAFPHDRYLKLTVRGSTPHNFFALLLDGLELTLRRFPGLDIDRRIPCAGHDGKPCTHEFELANLQRAIERKPPILEIQCPVAFENVSVPGLLVGLPWTMSNEVVSAYYKEILSKMEHLSGGINELRELTQREFTKIFYREQAVIEAYCPNVFSLRPAGAENWRDIFAQTMYLQLYCQAPGQWHPTENGGVYSLAKPAEWLKTMTPYIKKMVSVLKYAAPLVGPWLGFFSPVQYKQRFENDIKLMEALISRLPDIKEVEVETYDDPRLNAILLDSHRERVQGAALRSLRRLLDELDPPQLWGGLKRVLTPEGHYLWLCNHHSARYTV